MTESTKWRIESWMGNVLFDGKTFDSYDEAWGFIYNTDPLPPEDHPEHDHYYDDYYVEEIKEND